MPEVTKNIIILNALVFLAQMTFPPEWTYYLALHPVNNDFFQPYQILSHMFSHGDFGHVFFNMFAVFMFGSTIENVFGPKRYLIFYLLTGLGAAILHSIALQIEVGYMIQNSNPSNAAVIKDLFYHSHRFAALGASGAVFGLLAAFGMLYPNRVIMLLFPPIPMKAKYFVIIFGAIELYLGLQGKSTGVAHFAHVGGALFGALLILWWRYKGERF
jgi:membrane associated rhomboid family serine protease